MGVGACSFAGVNKLELLVEGVGSLENGLEACDAGPGCAAVSFDDSAGVACDLKPENVGAALKALLALLVSGWKVCAKIPEPVDLGCAVNMPAWGLSAPAVLAGCGVLKPLNKLGLLASGAFEGAGSEGFSAFVLVSLFCTAPKKLSPGVPGVVVGAGLASEANRFGLGVSEGALAAGSGALTLLNREGLGVPAASVGSLMALKGLPAAAGVCSWALGVCWPKVKGVDGSVALGSEANGLPAGADAGVPADAKRFEAGAVDVVPAVPNMFDAGAEDDVLALDCALEPKPLNKVDEGAVAVALPMLCALVPALKRLGLGVSCCEAPPCALVPKPLKMLFCAGAALLCEAPNPLNRFDGAGVPAVGALELAGAPNVKGAAAGAGVLEALAAELVVPNMFVEGALLVVPNSPPGLAALKVLFCARPPNGLLDACALNMEPPPNADVPLLLPFIASALCAEPNMLLLPPALKVKSFADGGWGLKPVLWLPAPKAGKDELVKLLLGAADWAGGKLLVTPPPNALLLAPNMPLVLVFPPTAGADAPKLKLLACGAAKFALVDGVCKRALASRFARSSRSLRRPSTVLYLPDGMARVEGAGAGAGADAVAVAGARRLGCTHRCSSCWAPYFGGLDPGEQRVSSCGKRKFFVAGSPRYWHGDAAHRVKVKGDSDLLARGQLGCRRPLRHLCSLFIALFVRALGLALAKDVCAFAGHDGGAGLG